MSKQLARRLRTEAEYARQQPFGKHPDILVLTHAAALRYAADLVEREGVSDVRHDPGDLPGGN